MLGAVYHANEEQDHIWRSRLEAGETLDESLGGWCYEHSVNYIPGSGFLSPGYANLSVELKWRSVNLVEESALLSE